MNSSRPNPRQPRKNILLTGRPGAGKTTIVASIVQRLGGEFGGFFTGEIREEGARKGFRITTLGGETAILAHTDIESPVRVGRYGVDINALDSLAVPALRFAMNQKRAIAIDEIGRMELSSEKFRQGVLEALASDCIVLATISEHPHPFTDAIKRRKDVKVFQVTSKNRNALPGIIEKMLKERLHATGAK